MWQAGSLQEFHVFFLFFSQSSVLVVKEKIVLPMIRVMGAFLRKVIRMKLKSVVIPVAFPVGVEIRSNCESFMSEAMFTPRPLVQRYTTSWSV